ncbi:MAG: uroporphyrinogen decarboxylase [Alphaproteobacteria bacterium]|nr:uroporphyrinogen decarboxylase [Alphaproteobacteria bacterium]
MAGHTVKPLIRALGGVASETPPVWLMRQAGRYLPEYRKIRAEAGTFLDLCYNPEKAAEVTLQPVRRYAMDAAILFSDILVVPDAMGQNVAFREGEGPVLEPVRDAAGIGRLDPDGVAERLAPVYATVERVAAALPDTVALIGFAGAPWTVASYMVEGGSSKDFREVKGLAYRDDGAFAALVDKLVTATVAHLSAQIDAGAEVVQIFDTWAGVLPEAEFERWCIAPTKAIVDGVRARAPNVPMIGFPRGAAFNTERYIAETGIDAVGLDTAVPLEVGKWLQARCAVQGNLDPILLVEGGAPMETAARAILSVLSGGPFVFNLGHGVLPQTPPEHVAQLLQVVRGG